LKCAQNGKRQCGQWAKALTCTCVFIICFKCEGEGVEQLTKSQDLSK
jgi:hypothetical protein